MVYSSAEVGSVAHMVKLQNNVMFVNHFNGWADTDNYAIFFILYSYGLKI